MDIYILIAVSLAASLILVCCTYNLNNRVSNLAKGGVATKGEKGEKGDRGEGIDR